MLGQAEVCRCFLQEVLLSHFTHPPGACHRPLPSRHLKQAFLYGPVDSTPRDSSTLFFCNRVVDIFPGQQVPTGGGTNGRQTAEHPLGGPLVSRPCARDTIIKVQFCLLHILRARDKILALDSSFLTNTKTRENVAPDSTRIY